MGIQGVEGWREGEGDGVREGEREEVERGRREMGGVIKRTPLQK